MKTGAVMLASVIALAMPARAAELRSIQVPFEMTLGWNDSAGEIMQSQFESTPQLELDLSSNSSLVLSTRLRLDAQDQLEPGTPALDSYAAASRPATVGSAGTLELRDIYWEKRLSSGLLRLGKQQIVWGRLDGLKVLDVLNPQNFREFILDDFADSRISQWSAYLDFFVGSWRVETALLADYSAHEIPDSDAWFELTAPRFRFGAQPGSPVLPSTTESGRDVLEDGAVGLRLSRSIGRIDVSALAYSGSDHEPLGRVIQNDAEVFVEQFYKRRSLFGASAETSLGSVALRAEAAYQPSRTFNTRGEEGLQTIEADQFSAGIAADIDGPMGIFINLQLLWDEINNAPSTLVRPDRDRVGTVFLRRSFAYDTVKAEARWYHSFDDNDDLYKLTLDYALEDNTTVFVSGDWFAGRSSGLFGQFAERDRVILGIRHTF
ncbi:MAG: hypothetical protein NWP69_11505 [Congregibacter sp.]|nr:hypothetical protein [Congregibacter sp.]MDP5070363.1 hypothetical protein [Congregibacter sp.]